MFPNIKQLILPSLLRIYTTVLRFIRSSRSRNNNRSVLILPPYLPGSLGDEAILTASVEYIKSRGIERIGLVYYDLGLRWNYLEPITEAVELSEYFHHDSWKNKFRFAHAASRYEQIYCFGTDVLDGHYSDDVSLQILELVSLAVETGAAAAILGFSFNDRPTPKSVQALRDLSAQVKLYSRDAVSQQRLMHHLDRPVKLVADLAFLLHPVDDSEIVSNVSQWIKEQQADSRTVVGVNANSMHVSSLKEESLDRLIQVYVDALFELFGKQQFSFVLIPHDFHSGPEIVSDDELAEAILKALPARMQSYCVKVPAPCMAKEIKSICKNLDIVLTSRMHLAIACLGQGTPVACVTYQGKFEGLFKHFELDGTTIEPEQAFQPGKLVEFFLPLIGRRDDISKHIRLKLPQIQQLARANFG